jgi:cytoskeletal protein RodZ
MKQDTETGIGRALRTARQRLGKSLEQASRETRVRSDYLEALELERFEALGDDVYVRGFLRSYAKFLGLNHDKVITVYERASGRTVPSPAPVERAPGVAPTEAVVLTEKRRPNWLLASGAALIALAAAAAVGLLSRSTAVPEPAPKSAPPAVPVLPRTVQVGVAALQTVDVEIVADGERETFTLDEGESRSFEADEAITVGLSEGETVELVVNGHRLRTVGERRAPYEGTFTPDSFRGTPSSGTSPSP